MNFAPKSLYQSSTVAMVILTVLIYGGARFFDAPQEVLEKILVVGVALIAIFMRRAIRRIFSDFQKTGESGKKIANKPLYRSMTVISSILTVIAYFVADHLKPPSSPEEVKEAILLIGICAIIIYMRRAMIAIFRDV